MATMPVPGGEPVTFTEFISRGPMGASPVESFSYDRCEATRALRCSWGVRSDLLNALMGDQKVQGGYLNRFTPHPYPCFVDPETDDPFMWATSITRSYGFGVPPGGVMKDLGILKLNGSDVASYLMCHYDVRYESPPFDIISDQNMKTRLCTVDGTNTGNPDEATLTRYVIRELQPTGQVITMPRGTMYFCSGPAGPPNPKLTTDPNISLAPPKMISQWALSLTHMWLPTRAVTTRLINTSIGGDGPMDLALGHVNAKPFPQYGPFANMFPAGTLLYVAATLRPIRSPTGRRLWNVSHKFQAVFNRNGNADPYLGHNYVPYLSGPSQFGWVEIVTDSNGNSNASNQAPGKNIYDFYDMSLLFRAP